MKKNLIVANWKMNGGFEQSDSWFLDFIEKYEADKSVLQNSEVVVCPPVILIDNMAANLMDYSFEALEKEMALENKSIEDFEEESLSDEIMAKRPFRVGAQNCHYEEKGAFTGDVSAAMIEEVGCEYVILGHSERRARHGESDEIVLKKIKAAHNHKLIPILCVGENKEVRDQKKHLEFVYKQLLNCVPQDLEFNRFVIAYEPIWAIGTGLVPEISEIKEMASLIRKVVREKFSKVAKDFVILYGGSVTSENSKEILEIQNVDGLLVGGASLKVEEFYKIATFGRG